MGNTVPPRPGLEKIDAEELEALAGLAFRRWEKGCATRRSWNSVRRDYADQPEAIKRIWRAVVLAVLRIPEKKA